MVGEGILPIAQISFTALETPGPSFMSTNRPHSVTAEIISNVKCRIFGSTGPTTIGRA